MKKLLVFLMVMSMNVNSWSQVILPQLQAGVYVNDTLSTYIYNFAGYCGTLPAHDVTYSIDPFLAPLVTGVHLRFIVTQLPPVPGAVTTAQTGVVNVGDTLPFLLPNDEYTFYSAVAGIMAMKLLITGTPQVPFEFYNCGVITFCTLADCNNTCQTTGAIAVPCFVDDFSGVEHINDNDAINVGPNPAGDIIKILNESYTPGGKFFLFDVTGRKVVGDYSLTDNETKVLLSKNISNGLHFWRVVMDDGSLFSGKLMIER
jgi:hypothetical protein